MNLAVPTSVVLPAARVPMPMHAPAPTPPAIDDSLVPGLRLPKIDGLPGFHTPGVPLRKIGRPPAAGSAAARADMDVVKGAQLLRTPEGDAWAVRMAHDGAGKIWTDLARRHAGDGRVHRWLDLALVASTIGTAGTSSAIGKLWYRRPRPFKLDPTIVPPFSPPKGKSYPSGHASAAYAAARVIATIDPSLAKEAYSLAQQVAVSRVYAGVHFPSDVVAGALVGSAVADRLLKLTGKSHSA